MLNPSAKLLILLVGAVLLSAGSAIAASMAKRTSDAAGVRVAVAPKANVPSGVIWEFEVVMDTHTKPLNDDLTKSAILLDGTGARHSPVEWQGSAPGGHHRKGVLRFKAPTQRTRMIELQITGVGGVEMRSFRWELQ